MAGERPHSLLRLVLAYIIVLFCGAPTMAQEVMGSDNLSDFPSPYRYIMNGSQLSTSGIDSVRLAPLTAALWDISPDRFEKQRLGDRLQSVNISTISQIGPFTIPYISCDDADVMEVVISSFNVNNNVHVGAAVLYSEFYDHCSISNALAGSDWLKLVTISGIGQARNIAALELNRTSTGSVLIFPDLYTLPPDTKLRPERKGSPIPMIILYALTSIITLLLLVVIIGGAIKARRHPERYGPRAAFRPRQSRAKGIAMAMLETLPIVKFGVPEPKCAKPVEEGRGVEMASTTAQVETENQELSPERHSYQTDPSTGAFAAGSLAANTSCSTPQPQTADEATFSTSKNNTESSRAPVAAGWEAGAGAEAEARVQESASPQRPADSLSCSICTEDFALGEELRVLPCDHQFHPSCVDPWLLNVSGTCPLCRIDLRSPQESTNEDESSLASAMRLPTSDVARRRSRIGGLLRGTMGLDSQSMVEASREDRIRFLRRWREERQLQSQPDNGEAGTGTARSNPASRSRSLRLSQWLKDGFSLRPSEEPPPAQLGGDASSNNAERPHTWYVVEAGAAGQTPRPSPSSNDGLASR